MVTKEECYELIQKVFKIQPSDEITIQKLGKKIELRITSDRLHTAGLGAIVVSYDINKSNWMDDAQYNAVINHIMMEGISIGELYMNGYTVIGIKNKPGTSTAKVLEDIEVWAANEALMA